MKDILSVTESFSPSVRQDDHTGVEVLTWSDGGPIFRVQVVPVFCLSAIVDSNLTFAEMRMRLIVVMIRTAPGR